MEEMWLARDKIKTLVLFWQRPSKDEYLGRWETAHMDWVILPIYLFPEVQWEDEEPTKVKLVIEK